MCDAFTRRDNLAEWLKNHFGQDWALDYHEEDALRRLAEAIMIDWLSGEM